jgi:mevalonate kinase
MGILPINCKVFMNKVTTSAPGKLLLFGDHAVVYGHPCIVTSIDQRIQVTVEKQKERKLTLSAPDLGLVEYTKHIDELGQKNIPKAVSFIETLYSLFLQRCPQEGGIVIETKSAFSSSFGFGSSSAVTVAFAQALSELYGCQLSKLEVFQLCYQAVITVQGVGSGFDIASAIWGKTIYYVTPAKVVEPIVLPELPLIVGYSGIKADTATIVRAVAELRMKKPEFVAEIFSEIENITNRARTALLAADWQTVGSLMNENQVCLEKLDVSSKKLNDLIVAARNAGAYGAKLSGAGGGDCMIALGEKKEQIDSAIGKAGGESMNVRAHADGVRVDFKE